MRITLATLALRADFDAIGAKVRRSVADAMSTPDSMLRFLGLYTAWNRDFGAGVASLSGKIARSGSLFSDPEQPIAALADRGVYVASYVFDAARAEFNDRANPARDTHRCLAQACVLGTAAELGFDAARVAQLCARPDWLLSLVGRVSTGYGYGTPDSVSGIGRAMGYHLGSEILAATEFTEIDRQFRTAHEDLCARLLARTVVLNGVEHRCYAWVSIHSDYGEAVEMEHFEHALHAVRLAEAFLAPEQRRKFLDAVLAGFDEFGRDHARFFEQIGG